MDPGAIGEQVDRILRSRTFASKSQLRKLLDILRKNMDSREVPMKPDQVIHELWPTEIRTKRSADVATEVNRLRHALESYYEGEGASDPITIYLPNRSVSAADGTHETRWMLAKPRGGAEDSATGDHPPRAQVDSRRKFKTVAAITGLAAALGIVGYVSIRVLAVHDQPKFGRLDGSTLTIMNAEGKELWRKVFPEGFGPESFYGQDLADRIWLGDLDGNGHASVLFVYTTASQTQSSTLICYSDRGEERWRWTPGRDVPELAGSPPTFKTSALRVLNATDKRPARIVVSSGLYPWWPNQIALLDASGKTISEYWHSGVLSSMVLADLDGDGKEEIIAAGVANGYDHQATLVVLDPDRVFGASTEIRPEFQLHGREAAQEKLRLLFPRSDLNRALFQLNVATDPEVEHGSLRLTVLECITPRGCGIWYEFDKNFRLIAAYAGSDEFRSAHERFYQTGKNVHPLTAEEQAAFQKVRCLVGCKSEFVPVGNLVP
jgi:hypothetical protein